MKLTHRWTPSWRAARSLLLLGLVAGTLAACASTEPDVGPPGSLTLTVGGLPTGSTTDITISGPNGYSSTQTMGTAPVTITDLEPGDYTITGTGFTAGGISYVPIPATQTAEVTSDAATDASVGFGSFVFVANMRAEDITPDGSTALLTDVNSITADFYFYNTGTNTNTFKAAAGDALFNFATGISSTLRVSAIHGKPEQAGLWTEAGGWQDLGNIYPDGCEYDPVTLEQNESGGWDIDAAGQSAVGLVWNLCNAEAFLWTEAGGFAMLDLLGSPYSGSTNPPANRATVISDDGSTLGGWAQDTAVVGGVTYGVDRWPAMWTSSGVGTMLPSGGVFAADCPGEVLAIAGNGSLVAGVWCQHAFLWSMATGTVDLTPTGFGYGQAVALNGGLVFGTSQAGFFDPPVPFVWTQADGVQPVLDIATANGIPIPANYWWQAMVASSEDGTVVVGVAYDEAFQFGTYVLKMPASVYGL